jgi:predicted secreted protein
VGLFLILVSRSPALVWDVQMTGTGKLGHIEKKGPRPYVNHYHFHILDLDWGHITIKMSGHPPPFGAQVMLNGHEHVACQARKKKIEFSKEGNCFTHIPNPTSLARIADILAEKGTVDRLRELCERWIYNTCLLFALDLEEQKRSAFEYQYSTYQIEYSRCIERAIDLAHTTVPTRFRISIRPEVSVWE